MKKKNYIAPSTATYRFATTSILMSSTLDKEKDDQSIDVTEEEYEGKFQSRRNVWEEEEEE